jgi:hypothetical protein
MRQQPLDHDPPNAPTFVRAARVYSNIASPPALFAVFAFWMAWADRPSLISLWWAALYGVLAQLLPVLYVVYLYKTGRVQDIHVSSPEERRIPYLVGLLGAVISLALVRTFADLPLLTNLILAHLMMMLVLTIANTIWLVSAHVSTITALTLLAGQAFGGIFALILFPFIPLTFYIRRYLKRHTIGELISGLVFGAGSVFVLSTIRL